MDIAGPLAPGESASQTWELPVSQEIDNNMEVHISGHSSGSATPVPIEADDNIQVNVDISELTVESAKAHIPAQSFAEDTTFQLTETDLILNTVIKQGMLSYSVHNNTELHNEITFILPNFRLDDEPFTQEFTLEPDGIHNVTDFDLANYELNRPVADNNIQAQVQVNIIDSYDPIYPDSFVVVDQNQMVQIDFSMSDLYFSWFEGVLDTFDLDIDQEPLALEDIPGGLENLNIESVEIDLQLSNAIGLPIYIDLILNAYKDGVLAETLNLPPLEIPPGDTTNPGLMDTTLSGIESIVNVVPDSIGIDGVALTYGETAVGEWQWMCGNFIIYTPFALQIGESTLEPEISELEEGFENYLLEVELNMELESHMPLSGEAFILASYDSSDFGNLAAADVDTFIHVALPPAVVGADGYVISPGNLTIEQLLNEEQLDMFASASEDLPVYIKTFIVIHSTEGNTVRMKPSDYISVKASTLVIVDARFEDENGGGN